MEKHVEEQGVGACYQDGSLEGQAEVWQLMLAFADSMAVKCAVELRIPDIINSHGSPMSLSQISSQITDSSFPDIAYLSRVMRLLVHKKVFNVTLSGGDGEMLYGLTASSRWLLHESEMTLAPMFLMENHPWFLAPWHQFSATIKEGGTAFEKAHGGSIWELVSKKPEMNSLFNSGMTSTAKVTVEAVLMVYKDGFQGVETLVDVGGGNGDLVANIVKASWPQIKGINFDLQHVVESAPEYPGVTHVAGDMFKSIHVAGDMFKSIPSADAIIMKWILHDWSDEDCVKILKNCKKSMADVTGKLILVEIVVEPEGQGLFNDTTMRFDLLMMAHCLGGRERTQLDWTNLLKDAGFSRYKFIKMPALLSVIEAYAS